jgi:hypothetical protein
VGEISDHKEELNKEASYLEHKLTKAHDNVSMRKPLTDAQFSKFKKTKIKEIVGGQITRGFKFSDIEILKETRRDLESRNQMGNWVYEVIEKAIAHLEK